MAIVEAGIVLKVVNLVLFLLLLLNTAILQASDLKPFTSDGCSAFPDGTIEQNQLWLKCCHVHDFAYWKGGTYLERMDADLALKECVAGVGQPEVALLMLAGVRVGGTPLLPTSFRWGYGWMYPKFYGPLTEGELKLIENVTKVRTEKAATQSFPLY